jgi:hypothetical protein
MTHVVAVVGRSPETPVRYVRWQGITIACSDAAGRFGGPVPADDNVYDGEDGCVLVQNAEQITFDACCVQHTGMHGYFLNGHAQRITITGNQISDIGGTGVLLNSPWFSAASANHSNTIDNNHIFDCGKVIGHGAGVQLVNSGGNRITHNRIHHTSRYAISLNAPRPGNLIGRTIGGVLVTAENAKQFAHTRDNTVAFNDLSHANLDSQDTAPLEAFGSGPGNRIDHNAIHDSDCPFSMGVGIYLDDAADGFTIANNVVYRLQHSGGDELAAVAFAKGIGNEFCNNIFADNRVAPGGAVLATHALGGEANRDVVFERNIVYRSGARLYRCANWQDDRFARVDHNLFDPAEAPYQIEGVPGVATLDDWRAVGGRGFNQRSLVADPEFIDPARGDYRLHPGSPAYRLGWQEIDAAAIGLRADYPFADRDEPPERLFIVLPAGGATLRLAVGARAVLRLIGRTTTGFVAELAGAQVVWRSADPRIATVDAAGQAMAHAPGMVRLDVAVAHRGAHLTTCVYVVIRP